MIKSMILLLMMSLSSLAFAREPKATLCAPQAIKAATYLYLLNNSDVSTYRVEPKLIEMDHSEGGFETWDIYFKDVNGYISSSPYRIKAVIDGCVIYSFSMPTAG